MVTIKAVPTATTAKRGPTFALGFADEISALRGKLKPRGGSILIPNGREWLAMEIRPFVNELTRTLFAQPALRPLGFWKDDIELGLQEGLSNSFAHAVRVAGKVWVRWQVDGQRAVFDVVDEGKRLFNLETPSSLRLITDALNYPLAGRGIGMTYIRRAADEVKVEPMLTPSGKMLGNKLIFTKYF